MTDRKAGVCYIAFSGGEAFRVREDGSGAFVIEKTGQGSLLEWSRADGTPAFSNLDIAVCAVQALMDDNR